MCCAEDVKTLLHTDIGGEMTASEGMDVVDLQKVVSRDAGGRRGRWWVVEGYAEREGM